MIASRMIETVMLHMAIDVGELRLRLPKDGRR
jgi:hypothetical protein